MAGHVFGPVPSRRLGSSLGVDLVRLKTCSYDCVYCQLGRTTRLRGAPEDEAASDEGPPLAHDGQAGAPERRFGAAAADHCAAAAEVASPEEVAAEVRAKLAGGARPDWITFAGSGEPTLYPRLGELIGLLRPLGVPMAVITNGSLLWREDVAATCARADLVSPTLVAGSEEVWRRINRPHASLDFARMVEGLAAFRARFRGQLWLEVMLVAGVNDSDEEVRSMAAVARRIRPDRVQLNTVVRPPAESSARPVAPERLAELARLFDPPAEVVAEAPRGAAAARTSSGTPAGTGRAGDVLALIGRHPATAEEVALGLGLAPDEAGRLLAALAAEGRAATTERGGRVYWSEAGGRS